MTGNGAGPQYDAIVVGAGHNGLTAAAYLARAGLRVCALERRDIVGGACVTEEVWPGQRVSRASYVVSMLQPKVVADGRPILFLEDAAAAHASLARVSREDADAMPRFDALFARMAEILRPMMLRPPPALGSRHRVDGSEHTELAGDRRPDLLAGTLHRHRRVLVERADAVAVDQREQPVRRALGVGRLELPRGDALGDRLREPCAHA